MGSEQRIANAFSTGYKLAVQHVYDMLALDTLPHELKAWTLENGAIDRGVTANNMSPYPEVFKLQGNAQYGKSPLFGPPDADTWENRMGN